MDGHGEFGDVVSKYIKDELSTRLFSHPMFTNDPKTAIAEVVIQIECELLQSSDINTSMSGSTLVLAMVRNRHLLVANIGDSRVVLGFRPADSSDIIAERLSIDHKPDHPEERRRILQNGGRIAAVRYEDGTFGPPRVWLRDALLPGLAMSRALCDSIAHMAGVSSKPDFFERELDVKADCMLIIATDGLWEFMNDSEAVRIASSTSASAQAVLKLIEVSNEKWLKVEKFIDDTTVCVAFLNGH